MRQIDAKAFIISNRNASPDPTRIGPQGNKYLIASIARSAASRCHRHNPSIHQFRFA